MSDREPSERRCADCGRTSPADASEYTLIGSRYGWRLSQRKDAGGRVVLEWRCAECHAKSRGKRGAGG